jgi:hypothetical protein
MEIQLEKNDNVRKPKHQLPTMSIQLNIFCQHVLMTGSQGPITILISYICQELGNPRTNSNLQSFPQEHKPDVLLQSETLSHAWTLENNPIMLWYEYCLANSY